MGLVTLEDILEELVGEIWDEHDIVKKEIEKISVNEYQVSGKCNFQKMLDVLQIKDDDAENDFVSVSGWMLNCSEHMPKIGDCFQYKNLTIQILNATEKFVAEVLVRKN